MSGDMKDTIIENKEFLEFLKEARSNGEMCTHLNMSRLKLMTLTSNLRKAGIIDIIGMKCRISQQARGILEGL
jgi:hypothetical protein